MTKLTWNNVVGQSTNAGTEALSNAGGLFNKALGSFRGIAEDKQNTLVEQNTAQALDSLRQLKSTDDFDKAAPELTTDALTAKFGAGNFDATRVSSAAESKRKSIIGEGRSDLVFKQSQDKLTRQLSREKEDKVKADKAYERLTAKQEKADKKDADREEVLNSVRNIPTLEQEVSSNTVAMTNALSTFTQAGAIKAGDVQLDRSGNPVFAATVDKDKKAAFLALAQENGYKPYLSLSDKVNAFRKQHPDMNEDVLFAGEQVIRDRYNRTLISKDAAKDILRIEKKLGEDEKRELERLQRNYERKIAGIKPGQIKSEEVLAKEGIELQTFYNKTFPKAVFGSSIFFTNDLGGSEGWSVVQDLLKEGVTLKSGTTAYPPPSVVQEALLNTGYNLTTGVTDAHFDEKELKEEVLRIMSADTFKEQSRIYLENQDIEYDTAVDKVLKKYVDKAASAKKRIYKDAGVTDRMTPRNILRFGE